jgi:hypothetical protein
MVNFRVHHCKYCRTRFGSYCSGKFLMYVSIVIPTCSSIMSTLSASSLLSSLDSSSVSNVLSVLELEMEAGSTAQEDARAALGPCGTKRTAWCMEALVLAMDSGDEKGEGVCEPEPTSCTCLKCRLMCQFQTGTAHIGQSVFLFGWS